MGGKTLLLLPAVTLLFLFFSCGSNNNDEPAGDDNTNTEEQSISDAEKQQREKELQMTIEYVKRSYEFMASEEGQRLLKTGEEGIIAGQEKMHSIAREVGFEDMDDANMKLEKYGSVPEVDEWVEKLFNVLPQEEVEGM